MSGTQNQQEKKSKERPASININSKNRVLKGHILLVDKPSRCFMKIIAQIVSF